MQETPLMANRANHINHFGTMIPGKMVPQILHTHPILDPKMSPRQVTVPESSAAKCNEPGLVFTVALEPLTSSVPLIDVHTSTSKNED